MASVKRDYYEVLNITRETETEQIEVAYRRLARQYHPDRNIGDTEAEVRFKEATEAREVLTDKDKRATYDRYGHAGLEQGAGGFGPGGGAGAGEFFSDLINGFFGGGGQQKRRGPQQGRDIQTVMEVTLLEAATGVKKNITIPRLESCNDCKGKGSKSGDKKKCGRCEGKGVEIVSQAGGFFAVQRTCSKCQGRGYLLTDPCVTCKGVGRAEVKKNVEVTVPVGVDTGMRMQLRGEGEAGEPGAARGDLEIVIQVAPHPDFERDGTNLITAIPITFSQAALGVVMDIPTLTGKTGLTIATGTQTNTEIRIKNEGIPHVRTGRKGDLRVMVIVETPTNLGRRQEELLRELAELEHKNVSTQRKGFLDRIKGLFGNEEDAKK